MPLAGSSAPAIAAKPHSRSAPLACRILRATTVWTRTLAVEAAVVSDAAAEAA